MQHFGTPNAEEKRAFTRVLQGHIAIDTAVFPNGTTGTFVHNVMPFFADTRRRISAVGMISRKSYFKADTAAEIHSLVGLFGKMGLVNHWCT